MLCLLCRWLLRQVSSKDPSDIDRITEFGFDDSWRMMETWWNHGVNDEALLGSDPYIDSIFRAYDEWDIDRTLGFQAFLRLAHDGSVWSMIQVAKAYRAGWGTTTDQAEAEAWYQRAHAGGSDEAMLFLGWVAHARNDSVGAEAILAPGVAKGLTPAMRRLAHVKLGLIGTRPARIQAQHLLEGAAARGDLGARWDLVGGQARGKFGVRYIPQGFRELLPLVRETISWMNSELISRGFAVSR